MISLDTFRDLFDYGYWARDRQLEACEALSHEQFLHPLRNSYSSVRDTLAHLVGAERIWMNRWRRQAPLEAGRAEAYYTALLATLSTDQLDSIPKMKTLWATTEQDTRQFLLALTEDELLGPIRYINLKGEEWTYPLWKTLLHFSNHQTYHRGQVTTLLRQLGVKPPATDFLVWIDQGTPRPGHA